MTIDNKTNLFLSVLKDMEPYSENVVLVGGWLPFIYSRYLWKQINEDKIVSTIDIDFALRENYLFKGKLIQDVFEESAKYTNERVYDMEETPVYYFAQANKERMRIDFISHEYVDPSIVMRMTGNKIEVAPIGYTELMLKPELTQIIDIKESDIMTKIRVPAPAVYMFLKGITCTEREMKNSEYKFKKDMWSVYFVIENCPVNDFEDLVNLTKSFAKTSPDYYKYFKDNILELFNSPQSKGPVGICELLGVPQGFINVRASKIVNNFIEKL